jgi:Ca-activated chloride channel homolog
MIKFPLFYALFALIPAVAFTMPAALAAQVKLEADLGQSAVAAKSSGSVYLRLSLKALTAAKKEHRTPLNVALVIDRSGSMSGDRIVAAREAANVALERLSADDVVSLVSYNHKVDVLHPAARLGSSHESLKRAIERLTPDGTTALYAGVKEGGQQVREFLSDTKVNRVILVSDGLANVGPSTPSEVASLGRELAGKGISVTTIGLGLDYNEDLMQRLAAASDGNHAFVESPRQLASIFDKEFGDALSVSARDIIIHIEFKDGFKPKRVLGREADISGNRVTLKMTQMQSDNERYVVLEAEVPAGAAPGDMSVAEVEMEYFDLDTNAKATSQASVRAKITSDEKEAEASLNKSVMSQVTEQVATENTEKSVELRDKGDIEGAKKMLQDNAAYLGRQKGALSSGTAAAPSASIQKLDELEKRSNEAANNLEGEDWDRTRKSMRYDQHKSKVQQKY